MTPLLLNLDAWSLLGWLGALKRALVRSLLPKPTIVKLAIADGFARDSEGPDGRWVWSISRRCHYVDAATLGVQDLLRREYAVHNFLFDLSGVCYAMACGVCLLFLVAHGAHA